MIKLMNMSPDATSDLVLQTVSEMMTDFPELATIKIIELSGISSPFVFGVRKPVIVLPVHPFSREELMYIFGHEVMHVRNHDVAKTLIIDLLCTLYWWNPLFKSLKNGVTDAIEMENDLKFTSNMSIEEKEGYLNCLGKVATLSSNKDSALSVSFSRKGVKELTRRFDLIVYRTSTRKLIRLILCTLFCASIFATTCVIFEPEFPLEAGVERISDADSYLIHRKDGQYDIYVSGVYFSTEDTAEYLKDIPIYEEDEYFEEKFIN
jgi:beta-lactamase regulating signal transducer with metallopeptidase domain